MKRSRVVSICIVAVALCAGYVAGHAAPLPALGMCLIPAIGWFVFHPNQLTSDRKRLCGRLASIASWTLFVISGVILVIVSLNMWSSYQSVTRIDLSISIGYFLMFNAALAGVGLVIGGARFIDSDMFYFFRDMQWETYP